MFFQVGLGFDSGFGFQIFVFCFSLGFKAGLRGLIGVFDTANQSPFQIPQNHYRLYYLLFGVLLSVSSFFQGL